MDNLFIQIDDLKSYTRLIKKHNRGIKHSQILDQLTQTMGFDHYAGYERYLKTHAEDPGFKAQSADSLSLPELERWAWRFSFDLEHGLNLQMPPSISLLNRSFPSTPVDRQLQFQAKNLDRLPALRLSGILYLISLTGGRFEFDPQTLDVDAVNWNQLADAIEYGPMPTEISSRLLDYEAKNQREGTRYHEGVFEQAHFGLLIGHISAGEFIEQLQALMHEEIDYLESFSKPARFSFPRFVDLRISKPNLDLFFDIRSRTDRHQPLLLGLRRPEGVLSKFIGASRSLTMTGHTLGENLLITGVAGSGRSYFNLNIIKQAIMNDSGAIYVSAKGSTHTYWELKSLARAHNKEDQFTVIGINHPPSISTLSAPQCVRQKAVKYVMLPGMEKDPEVIGSHFWAIIRALSASVQGEAKPMKANYFPYCVILDDISLAVRNQDDADRLGDFIDRMNAHNIAVIVSDQTDPFVRVDAEPLVKRFRSRALMKQEHADNEWGIGRDLVRQGPGEFRFQTIGAEPEPNPYLVPFEQVDLVEDAYLVIK